MSNTQTASKGAGSSFPFFTVVGGLWSYFTVPAISSAGGIGIVGAALVGIGTGLGASVLGLVGALGGLVVGGAALGAVGLVANKPGTFAAIGGIGGLLVGGLAGTFGGAYFGYGMSKDVVVDYITDNHAEQKAESTVAKLEKLKETANVQFAENKTTKANALTYSKNASPKLAA